MIDATAPARPLRTVLIMLDYDGTWNDPRDPATRHFLDEGLVEMKDEFRPLGLDVRFGIVSARDPIGINAAHLPSQMDYTVSSNGGQIQIGNPGQMVNGQFVPTPRLQAWYDINKNTGYQKAPVAQCIQDLLADKKYENLKYQTIGQVAHVPSADSSEFMYTPCFDEKTIALTPHEKRDANGNGVPDIFEKPTYHTPQQIEGFMTDLKSLMANRGIPCVLSPAYPYMGQPYVMFDATSPMSEKGDAVTYLQHMLGIPASDVIVGGDGGNDITMMRAKDGTDDGRRVITVSGEDDLYEAAAGLKHVIEQPGAMNSSLGVLDGVRRHLLDIAAETPGAA